MNTHHCALLAASLKGLSGICGDGKQGGEMSGVKMSWGGKVFSPKYFNVYLFGLFFVS